MSRLFVFPLIAGLVFAVTAEAIVFNKVNGSVGITNIDFSIPGSAVPLELARTYNSITALSETSGWNGAFGWGWTSIFETTLISTAEKNVLLRDGVTGNNILFRPQKDDPKAREEFYLALKKGYFEQKMGRKLSAAEVGRLQWPEKVLSRLKSDLDYRTELAVKFGIPGVVPKGDLLISTEFGYQTVQLKGTKWYRRFGGITQTFDRSGHLIEQEDRNGHRFLYRYSKGGKLSEIGDPDKTYSIKFIWKEDHVVELIDNRNRRSKYTYDSAGNLTNVTDSGDQSFIYTYGNKRFPHLLTRIEYVSESKKSKVYRELAYDENGLVTLHRDKDGSETTYQYGKNQSDPENNFWTSAIRKMGGKTTEDYDEYVIKTRADGSKYLHKQIQRSNGNEMITLFTACCGKPQQIIKNGESTHFKYFDNGLLKERVGGNEEMRLEYDTRWNKVSKVYLNGTISTYEYDDRGNLKRASNSNKESVTLKYDRRGRVASMFDSQSKEISFQYNDLGKPAVISQKGVGTIRLEYDSDGRVKRALTVATGIRNGRFPDSRSQEIVRKVMISFQSLLALLKPAGVSISVQ